MIQQSDHWNILILDTDFRIYLQTKLCPVFCLLISPLPSSDVSFGCLSAFLVNYFAVIRVVLLLCCFLGGLFGNIPFLLYSYAKEVYIAPWRKFIFYLVSVLNIAAILHKIGKQKKIGESAPLCLLYATQICYRCFTASK